MARRDSLGRRGERDREAWMGFGKREERGGLAKGAKGRNWRRREKDVMREGQR